MTFDKEIEAIAKCTELIKDLDNDAKFRVIEYLIKRFGIGTTNFYDIPQKLNGNQDINSLISDTREEVVEYTDEAVAESFEYPTLKDLLIKNYPKNEAEWILVYSFYSSGFGKDIFTKDDIIEKYKDNGRQTRSNSANLGNNLKSVVKKDWIKSINETQYIMKNEGTKYAQEVIKGNSVSKERKSSKRQKSEE